jgi:hypothetical protein
MKKKEVLFDEEIFNEKVYADTRKKYEEMAEKLPDLLASLAAEGLPTDWRFVEDITCNESAFREWVNMQKEERHKGKFLTISELERLSEELNDFYDRVIPTVNAIRRMRIERLPLFDADGLITVDFEKIEQIARKAATTRINATKIQAYWEQVNKVVDAMAELRSFEEKNGLPDFVNEELVFVKQGRPQRYNLNLFLKEGGEADLFQQITAPYFSKK